MDRTYMNSKLYDAAAEGSVEAIKDIGKDAIESWVTPNKNTILHINILSQNEIQVSTNFVKDIIKICPSLLLKVNARGDTPLHVAAQRGRVDIVRVLIERANDQRHDDLESGVPAAKQMIRMQNNKKNTALHEAFRRGSLDIVKILMKEEPDYPYSANDYGETPLYMAAARRKCSDIVTEILENCPLAAHEGPDGKTALHAAVIVGSKDAMKKIFEKKKSLTRERDQHGWTPRHYAAYVGWKDTTEPLLKFDRYAANIVEKDRKMTPLHLAAARGHKDIVPLIIKYCPECYDLVDERGWNFLHFAMISLNAKYLRLLLKNPLARNLINVKDVKGNTPLHLLAVFSPELTREMCFEADYKADYEAFNKQNMRVVYIMMRGGFPELQQEIQELAKDVDSRQYPNGFIRITEAKLKTRSYREQFEKFLGQNFIGIEKAVEYHLVMAALIATVTFAAGFTLPGGYRGEEGPKQGTAILSRNEAFQAFVITDATALVLSLSAVFIHFLLSLKVFKDRAFLFAFALLFTMVAMVSMVIAFIAGTYAVLSPSLRLAIPTCFIGLIFFLSMFCLCYMAWLYSSEKREELTSFRRKELKLAIKDL